LLPFDDAEHVPHSVLFEIAFRYVILSNYVIAATLRGELPHSKQARRLDPSEKMEGLRGTTFE
jgi:hypothetical protein